MYLFNRHTCVISIDKIGNYLAILQVYFNKADIATNVIIDYEINKLFDYIVYGYQDYYFVGPKPEMLPQIKNLSYPFDTITWLLLLFSLLSNVIMSLLVQKIFKVGLLLNTITKRI